jgi:hypothetical protein
MCPKVAWLLGLRRLQTAHPAWDRIQVGEVAQLALEVLPAEPHRFSRFTEGPIASPRPGLNLRGSGSKFQTLTAPPARIRA